MRRLYSFFLSVVFLLSVTALNAQPWRGTTGLLHAPTAEMQDEGTFLFGANVLDLETLHFFQSNEVNKTYNYYLNISFFSWLEVGYTCTLNYADHGHIYFPEPAWGTYSNQDRTFNLRARIWKEGWLRDWTPQIVAGFDDPTSHVAYGGGTIGVSDDMMQNNYFTRYYLAASKHFLRSGIFDAGVHLSYVYGMAKRDEHYHGVACGFSIKPALSEDILWHRYVNGIKLMAEYDARAFNVGVMYSLWRDHINLWAELYGGKAFNGGLMFRFNLLR